MICLREFSRLLSYRVVSPEVSDEKLERVGGKNEC